MAYEQVWVDRLQLALMDIDGIESRKMFGGVCFMLRGHMLAGTMDEGIMVRVGPEKYEHCLDLPGARTLQPPFRPMKGLITIEAEHMPDQEAIRYWLDYGLAFVNSLPAKKPARKRKPRPKKVSKM